MPDIRTVQGEIVIPPMAEAFTPARVLVQIEDVSRADAPSQIVGQAEIDTGELLGGDTLPFAVDVPGGALDDRHLYSVRVHIAQRHDGDVAEGDYITTQSYPVLTQGFGDEVRVLVKRV